MLGMMILAVKHVSEVHAQSVQGMGADELEIIFLLMVVMSVIETMLPILTMVKMVAIVRIAIMFTILIM